MMWSSGEENQMFWREQLYFSLKEKWPSGSYEVDQFFWGVKLILLHLIKKPIGAIVPIGFLLPFQSDYLLPLAAAL